MPQYTGCLLFTIWSRSSSASSSIIVSYIISSARAGKFVFRSNTSFQFYFTIFLFSHESLQNEDESTSWNCKTAYAPSSFNFFLPFSPVVHFRLFVLLAPHFQTCRSSAAKYLIHRLVLTNAIRTNG